MLVDMKRLILTAALIGSMFVTSPGMAQLRGADSGAFYCDRNLVRVGDPIWRVGRRCPEPFWVERWQEPLGYDRLGRPLAFGAEAIETWYLNFGHRRLMRRLTFRNGHLIREESLGYGVPHVPGTRRCDARKLQHAGDTVGEIYARCGEPDYRYDFSTSIGPHYGGPWPLPRGSDHQLWAYDFGRGRLVRELYFIDGRLIHSRVESP